MSFTAKPPSRAWPTLKGSGTFAGKVLRYFWQPLVPFDAVVAPQAQFPTTFLAKEEEENCVEFCRKIFDDAEDRRSQLEQKAQWTFTAVGLITPSLASIFVFVLSDPTFTRVERAIPIALLVLSATIMLLSYVSAARALWVREREVLYLGAVIDLSSGAFVPYNAAERARGYLYCATLNTANNDHIAQFVRGAQVLAACSIILFSAGAVSTTFRSQRSANVVIRSELTNVPKSNVLDLAPLGDALTRLARAMEAEQQARADSRVMKGLTDRIDAIELVQLNEKKSLADAVGTLKWLDPGRRYNHQQGTRGKNTSDLPR